MVIESLENEKVKLWKKLRTSKYINEYNLFIVEGYHLVLEAIKTGYVIELIVTSGTTRVLTGPFKINYVTEKVMSSISLLESVPPIMAVCKIKEVEDYGTKLVLLDDVQDPGNIGTIIRNSVAFGIDTVVLSKNSVSPYNDKLVRATQGMFFHINIVKTDLKELIYKLKENDIKVYATCLDGSKEMKDVNFSSKFAVIFGNEGNGISKEIKDISDEKVRIKMDKRCESLNVGVSSGIILYNLME